jgi:hypothetical protein
MNGQNAMIFKKGKKLGVRKRQLEGNPELKPTKDKKRLQGMLFLI